MMSLRSSIAPALQQQQDSLTIRITLVVTLIFLPASFVTVSTVLAIT